MLDRPPSCRAPLAVLVLGLVVSGLLVVSPSVAEPGASIDEANPYLAFLPTGATSDARRWSRFMRLRAAERRAAGEPHRGVAVAESEPNDTPGMADPIPGFGTEDGESAAVDVAGSFTPPPAPTVLAAAGTHAVRILGTGGAYSLELRVFRQPDESASVPKILFVDFDGATFDRSIFLGASPEMVTLSPLSSFLADWGLGAGDEDAVIDAVLATLHENLAVDPHAAAVNPDFGVEIRNSRDHVDPFGQPGVSRLIIGGTIPELGLATIGIAQSIDPGNFEAAETAVVLLDLLSRPAPDPDSLNSFPRAPGASMVDFVGVAPGNIAAHEAGHVTGSFHTENRNPTANLMDRGGNLLLARRVDLPRRIRDRRR